MKHAIRENLWNIDSSNIETSYLSSKVQLDSLQAEAMSSRFNTLTLSAVWTFSELKIILLCTFHFVFMRKKINFPDSLGHFAPSYTQYKASPHTKDEILLFNNIKS